MLRSLGQIHNPLLRSITAGSTSLAMATLIAALAINFTKPNDKEANRTGVYASLLAFIAGAGIGLAVKERDYPSTSATNKNTDLTWKDWRDFKIVKKKPESKEITSFYFQPVDGGKIPSFKPGQ